MALTDKGVRALKAKTRAYRVSDKGGIRGLNLQVTPAGKKNWILRYSDATGKERFHTFGEYPGTTLGKAREKASLLKIKARAKGTLQKPQEEVPAARVGTVEDLINGYVSDLKDRGAATADQVYQRLALHVIPMIGDQAAKTIVEDQINAVLAKVYHKGHRVMANRIRGYLLTAWKWGRKHDRDYRYQGDGVRFQIQHNPVADIPRDAAAESVVDRVLTWHEIKMLWHACTDVISLPIKLCCQLCLATGGQRPGEILGIHDGELDLAERLWRIPGSRTKNGLANIIPLNDLAAGIITQARFYR